MLDHISLTYIVNPSYDINHLNPLLLMELKDFVIIKLIQLINIDHDIIKRHYKSLYQTFLLIPISKKGRYDNHSLLLIGSMQH